MIVCALFLFVYSHLSHLSYRPTHLCASSLRTARFPPINHIFKINDFIRSQSGQQCLSASLFDSDTKRPFSNGITHREPKRYVTVNSLFNALELLQTRCCFSVETDRHETKMKLKFKEIKTEKDRSKCDTITTTIDEWSG